MVDFCLGGVVDFFFTMFVDLFFTIFCGERGWWICFSTMLVENSFTITMGVWICPFTNFRGVGGFTGFGVGLGMVEDFVLNIWSYYTAAKSPLTNPQPYKSRSFTTSIASYLFRECKKRTYPAPSGHESQEKGILLP